LGFGNKSPLKGRKRVIIQDNAGRKKMTIRGRDSTKEVNKNTRAKDSLNLFQKEINEHLSPSINIEKSISKKRTIY
jgi:hypothetical protein